MNNLIGKKVIYEVDGLKIECTVEAIKWAYGRYIYKLIPVAGSGFKWTNKTLQEIK